MEKNLVSPSFSLSPSLSLSLSPSLPSLPLSHSLSFPLSLPLSIFKRLNLLRIDDIFTCQCMSFYHKYVNNYVPLFCKSLFTCNATHHEYQTRHNMQLSIPYSHTSRARKSIRYHLPSLLRRMPQCVIEKVHTHSLNGFSLYLKKHLLSQYNDSCSIANCYICGRLA